ncbi:thiol reductant ABC exporter subunit CydD [Agromyces sp. SYSU T00194]|uniref:thiol reductant ABC exporter subunit CydD n=1 Tax=Agromyces chitinivorans TaxID=3158560 RepID=UPI00339111E4
MRPLEPALLRHARSARAYLAGGAVLAGVQAGAILVFAWQLQAIVVGLIGGVGLDALAGATAWFAAAVVVRALVAWAWGAAGTIGAATVASELRVAALRSLAASPERATGSSVDAAVAVGGGLDALQPYFGRFLPQLVATVVVVPVLVVATWLVDPLSGLILVIVIPLIPVFMVLIGLVTRAVQERQWAALTHLSRQFLELVGGLSTLIVYGRQHRQEGRIRADTEDYRVRTMRVLRVTFLSSFVLELAASLSVALVAVSIGLRLVDGAMAFAAGLFVLLLAPEVFLPLRNVGAQFHASAEGIEASREVLALIDGPGRAGAAGRADASAGRAAGGDPVAVADAPGARPGAAGRTVPPVLEVRGLVVEYAGRRVVDGLDLAVRAGEVVALGGPSGAGKSSVLSAILGFVPSAGEIAVDGRRDAHGRRGRLAWAGQDAVLLPGTVTGNVALGAETADSGGVSRALREAGSEDLDPGQAIGAQGAGLSGGQSERVQVARALYRLRDGDLPLLVLDEPTSATDADREARLVASLRALAREGRAVLVVSHRPAVLEAAHRVVRLEEAARVG